MKFVIFNRCSWGRSIIVKFSRPFRTSYKKPLAGGADFLGGWTLFKESNKQSRRGHSDDAGSLGFLLPPIDKVGEEA